MVNSDIHNFVQLMVVLIYSYVTTDYSFVYTIFPGANVFLNKLCVPYHVIIASKYAS